MSVVVYLGRMTKVVALSLTSLSCETLRWEKGRASGDRQSLCIRRTPSWVALVFDVYYLYISLKATSACNVTSTKHELPFFCMQSRLGKGNCQEGMFSAVRIKRKFPNVTTVQFSFHFICLPFLFLLPYWVT